MTHKTHTKRTFGAHVLFLSAVLGGTFFLMGGPAHAQFDGAYGRQFSNPLAATLSIRMQQMGNATTMKDLLRPLPKRRVAKPTPLGSIGANTVARGRAVIAAGKATTVFKEAGYYVITDHGLLSEHFDKSLRLSGLATNDLSDIVSYGIAKSLEGWDDGRSAPRVGTPQFKALRVYVRNRLLQDARVQGLDDFGKDTLAETFSSGMEAILNAFSTGRIFHDTGSLQSAKVRASHVCEVWLGVRPERIALTATGVNFNGSAKPVSDVKSSASTDEFATDSASDTSSGLNSSASGVPSFDSFDQAAPSIGNSGAKIHSVPSFDSFDQPASSVMGGNQIIDGASPPQATSISFEAAKRVTSFKPSGAPLIPALLVKGMQGSEAERAKAKALLGQVLASVRANLHDYSGSNLPLDNVARAQVYALSQLYPLLTTPRGKAIDEQMLGFTPENMQVVRRQFALALGSDAGFRALSDREKQEMYETYLVVPTLATVLYEAALQSRNEEGQKMARDLARETLQQMMGAQANQLHFSPAGLEIF